MSLLFLDITTDRQELSFNGYKLEDAKMLSYYGLGAGDIVDLQRKCTECDESCDVAHNKLGLRKRRDITEKKTVFDNIPDFMAACGKDFFLDGKFPEGLQKTHSKKFICQTYKNNRAYFATKFDTTRKTADFSAYKPSIGNLGRPPWKNLYEHGTYVNYMIYMHFSSHIYWAFSCCLLQQYPKARGMRNKPGLGCSVAKLLFRQNKLKCFHSWFDNVKWFAPDKQQPAFGTTGVWLFILMKIHF